MLDRLKSLSLTILLTILIWIYAEAQFTTTQQDVPINVRIAAGTSNFAVRTLLDPATKRYSDVLSFVVTLQGPKSQIDQIFQESQGAVRDRAAEDRLAALTFIPTVEQLRQAAGGEMHPYVLPMLNRLDYFRSRGVTVTFAAPDYVSIEVDSVTRLRKDAAFQSAVAVDSVTLDPGTVEVLIPSQTLRTVGESKIAVRAVPQNEQQLAALPPDTDKAVPVRFVVDYPGVRDDRIRVEPGQGTATVRLRRTEQSVLNVNDVPVWVSGPPALLGRYDVEVTPRLVTVVLSGPNALMDATRQRLAGGPKAAGIGAYLDLTPDDHPDKTATRRNLRYIIPDGLSLRQAPPDVAFKLSETSPPASAGASASATASQPNGH
jgi:hypothetical protein